MNCQNCNIIFAPKTTNQLYCSHSCRNKQSYIRVINKIKLKPNICFKCSTPTTNSKFCSKSCAASFNNILTPKRKLENKCKNCPNLITVRKTYCSNCLKTFRSHNYRSDLTLGEAIYNKAHKSSAFALVRSRARTVLQHMKKSCLVCGYDKHIEAAHKIPISKFPLETKLSIINAETNILPLCPNHHWEFDHGLLSL